MSNKALCFKCGEDAVWAGKREYCDNCVPRGCSCNIELKYGIEPIFDINGVITNPESDYEEKLDSLGRKQPCCEILLL